MTDIQFPNLLLSPGTFTAELIDNNGVPSTVLEAGQEITVKAEWTISALAALLMGGQWEVAAYAESIGPGVEKQIGDTVVKPLDGSTNYNAEIKVPANTLPDNLGPGESGAYKVVVLLTHRNFGKVSDVAAIVEFPVVRIS
ncbi:MAG TPA: hypothetical protein VFY38_07565 [Pseudonocardia sp.]|nr:hypothetical protein [Pseudonocardia sp.]